MVGIIGGGKEFMQTFFQNIKKYGDKYKKELVISQLLLFSVFCFFIASFSKKEDVSASADILPILPEQFPIEKNKEEEVKWIKVDLKGAVLNPGVYEMEEGSRIIDVIERCGGLKEEADTKNVNLSKKLTDEMVIKIPTIYEEEQKEENVKEEGKEKNDKISLNQATLSELMEIPGIGEAKAKAIMKHRALSPFETIEDVIQVDGIGEKLFEKIKEFILP